MSFATLRNRKARRPLGRRAFSLFELLAVLTIVGLVSGAAIMRFGNTAFQTTSAEGFVRKLSLDMAQARRRAIASGDDHHLQFDRDAGVVVSYSLIRAASGGDTQVDDTIGVPAGAVVTTSSDTWTFDFAGSLTSAGDSSAIRVDGPNFFWDVTVFHATGSTRVVKTAQP